MQILPEGKKLILASKSPRRQQLLKDLGLDFEIHTKEVEESYPDHLKGAEIAEFLAIKKAMAFQESLSTDSIVLTSDTVVWCNGKSLEKASDAEEAKWMLEQLSGNRHNVITGVCLFSKEKKEVFSDTVEVTFRKLKEEEVQYYIDNYHPFDKAGAYGIQEWIGMAAITSIKGSFFTVMGLPTHLIMEKLPLF